MADRLVSGYRLSPQQRRLCALLDGGSGYRAQAVVAVADDVDEDALREAVRSVVERHEILRTTYERPAGRKLPVQVVSDAVAPEWRTASLPGDSRAQGAFDALLREEGRGFDLERGPVLRLCLTSGGSARRKLIVTLPALATDALGLQAFVGDVAQALAADAGQAQLVTPPIQYPDAAEVMNGLAEADGLAERSRRLREALWPLPGPVLGEGRGPAGGRAFEPRWVERRLDGAALRRTASALGASPDAVLLGVWQALLWRVTGAESLVVAVGLDGRTHEGLEGAIGVFTRYVPLTARLEGSLPFAAALRDAANRLAEAAEWQDFFSWERVAGEGAEPALVSIGFDCTERAAASGTLPLEEDRTCLEPFHLRLSCVLSGDALTAGFVHDDRFVSSDEAERIADRYHRMLADVLQRPQAPLRNLEVLPESERRVLAALNATDTPADDEATLVDLFEAQAASTPGRQAVACGAETLDFGTLDARANRLAHALRRLGAGPDVPVGLLVNRSVGLIEGLLGILKSGGAYVPLDPATPAARMADVLTDVGARLVVTEEALLGVLPAGPWETVCLDRDRPQLLREPESRPPSLASAQQLAYVIYTSGSTGRPKGVAVTHGGLANSVRYILARLEVRPGWSFGLASTIAADLGHTSLYPSLASGGCLHVLPREVVTDAVAFAGWCAAQPLDVLKILPSHFAALLASGDASVLPRKWLVFGGEALPRELCRRVAGLGGTCRILNHYGPTETTVGSLTWGVDAAEAGDGVVPVGRPIARTEAHVIDHSGQRAPLGVAGELYLGGAGLARGYVGRADQTAERFVPNPYAVRPGERLYRTGDRVRCRRDGSIEFQGRTDHQVKIRGHRVEPGEVEAALLGHGQVAQAVVVARREEGGDPRLVAYLVSAGGAPDTHSLRSFLSERLPEHMIPAAFVTLPALPRGASGKVDRAALPAPETLPTGYVAPRNEAERTLAGIWAEVLRVPRVGIHENFFERGGDSIISIQIAARAARLGLELTPLQVFRHPTVALSAAVARRAGTPPDGAADVAAVVPEGALAVLLGAIGEAAASGPRAAVARDRLESVRPLSPLQQGILFHCVYDAGSRPYVTQVEYTLPADTDLAAFAGAWQLLADRHAILRTAFAWEGLEEPLQAALRGVRVPVGRHDLSGLRPGDRAERLESLAEADLASVSRMGEAPLFRLTLARLEGGAHRCLFTYHHLLLDGWSEVIVSSELKALYDALRAGAEPRLSSASPYAAYVDWLRGQDISAAEAFWRRRLAGFDSPTPLPGLADEAAAPSVPRVRQRVLGAQLTGSLQHLARRRGLTLNTLVQGAWALALGQASERDDVVFGATLSGRPATLPGAESIVGPFINTLPVRVRLDGRAEVGSWLAALQEAQLELRAHEYSPLVHVQRWSGVPVGRRLFDSLLVFQNAPQAEGDPGFQVEDVVVRDGATNFPLSLDVRPGAQLTILASHDPRRLGDAAVERLLHGLETALAAFAADPAVSVDAVLARLREADREHLQRADEEIVASSRQRLRHAVRRAVSVGAEEER